MKKYAMIIAIALILILMVTMAGCFEGCNPGNEDPPTEEHVMEAYELALDELKEENWLGENFLVYINEGEKHNSAWVYGDKLIRVQKDEKEKVLYHEGYKYIYNQKTERQRKSKDDSGEEAEKYKQMKTYYQERILEVLESDMERKVDQLSDFIYKTYPDWVILEFDRNELDGHGYEDIGEVIKIETRLNKEFRGIQMCFVKNNMVITIRTVSTSDKEWKYDFPFDINKFEYIE